MSPPFCFELVVVPSRYEETLVYRARTAVCTTSITATDNFGKHTTSGAAAVAKGRNFSHILQQLVANRTTAERSKCSRSAVGKFSRTPITLSNCLYITESRNQTKQVEPSFRPLSLALARPLTLQAASLLYALTSSVDSQRTIPLCSLLCGHRPCHFMSSPFCFELVVVPSRYEETRSYWVRTAYVRRA